MAEINIPRAVTLRRAVRALGIMADDAHMLFTEERGLVFVAVCIVGNVDAILFLHKVLHDDFCVKSFHDMQFPSFGRASAGVELARLDNALAVSSHLDPVNFKVDPVANLLHVRIQDAGVGVTEGPGDRDCDVGLTRIPHPLVALDAPYFVYDVVVGISSDRFEKLTDDLRKHSEIASISVVKTHVRLRVKDKEILLHQEKNECVIGGDTEAPMNAAFSLYRLEAFKIASELSEMVWLCLSKDSPFLLNFPVGSLGNLHVYSRI